MQLFAPNSPISPAMDDLGTLGGTISQANAISASGRVAGDSTLPGDTVSHAFLTATNSPINPATEDLGALPGFPQSQANGLNGGRQVVRFIDVATPTPGSSRAFLFQDGTMVDLNTRIPAGSGWVLIEASSINDVGQIVGEGLATARRAAFS